MAAEAVTAPTVSIGDGDDRRGGVLIAAAGGSMTLALLIALLDRGLWPLALAIAGGGALTSVVLLGLRFARRGMGALLAGTFAVAIIGLWIIDTWVFGAGLSNELDRLLDGGVLLALVALASAVAGLVLIADGLRQRAVPAQSSWRQMTDGHRPAIGASWRVVVGVLLVGWTVVIAFAFIGGHGTTPLLAPAILTCLTLAAFVMIATPMLVAGLSRAESARAGADWEEERQRFAAHLHDSVLQTLALIQRQASDPIVVARLARRQEHALRAWMAGEAELVGGTLGAALREAVAAVEDEEELSVETSIIGDRNLDAAGEALVAAAREALRNAACHARGAAVFVFAELSPQRAEVFVRDDGPGFDLAAVAAERRGVRDAIVGRMDAAGGSARIETAPGQGTEVAFSFPREGSS